MAKAQSAMEFMLTYGWAILVVMVVGIVMWQIGVFNIGGTVPPRVTGTNYQKPIDATLHFYATAPGVAGCHQVWLDCMDLDMVNGEPGSIRITALVTGSVNGVGTTMCTSPPIDAIINQGEKYTIDCIGMAGGPELTSGDMATAELTINYDINIVGITRSRSETLIARGPVE